MRTRLAIIRAAACLLAVFAARAPAQVLQAPLESRSIELTARFGLGDVFAAECWTPIRFTIEAEDPLSGLLTVSYRQDGAQSVSLSTPYAATPGVPTRVDVVVCPGNNINEITVSLTDQTGRPRLRRTYSTIGASSRSMPAPAVQEAPAVLFASLAGRAPPALDLIDASSPLSSPAHLLPASTAARAESTFAQLSGDGAFSPWRSARTAAVDPSDLPLAWAAYDAFDAVVVRASDADRILPRALDELHRWVRGGGRLVIIADGPGDGWRRLLPAPATPTGEGDMTLGPVAVAPLPAAAAEDLARWWEQVRKASSNAEDDDRAAAPLPSAVPARPVRLGPGARLHAWAGFWPVAPEGSADGHLFAYGPVGFGMVAVVGVDPDRLAASYDQAARALVWAGLLEPVIDEALARSFRNFTARRQWWSGPGSGATVPEQGAIAMGLDAVAEAPALGGWVVLLVLGAGGVLAVLVGPVDAIVLKRLRLRQRSWLTALGWTALASALALGLPRVLRTEQSRFGRLLAVDQIAPAPGEPILNEAWTSGLASMFAASGLSPSYLPIEDPGLPPGEAQERAWWRGVSPLAFWGGDDRTSMPPLQLVQLPAPGLPDGVSFATSIAANPVPLWSLRTAADRSVTRGWMTASVEPLGEGRFRVRVGGVPRGMTVEHAALRTQGGWFPLALRSEGDDWLGETSLAARTPDAPPRFRETTEPDAHAPLMRPGRHADLPGAAARGAAIDRRVRSGRWAMVQIVASGASPDIRPDVQAIERGMLLARLLVPLSEDARALLSPASPTVHEEPAAPRPSPEDRP